MAKKHRVTVTLPPEIVEDIDRRELNRSQFILTAIRRELRRRQREELLRSLRNPHPESQEMAELGMSDWANSMPEEDAELLDPGGGREVRWTPEQGWVELEKPGGSQ